MAAKSKLIRVTGIKNVDTLISVYNDAGIKTAALFDNRMAYTYELSVPLKTLDLTINNPAKFAYQLKINEVQSHGINIPNANAGGDMAGNLARMTGISVSAGAAANRTGKFQQILGLNIHWQNSYFNKKGLCIIYLKIMKGLKIIIIKQTLFAFLFCIAISADAQKLPTEQQVSLRAPAGLKIDGKATEWDNKFQAYNHHTDFYYTIANDDNNLYLIVQANEPAIIKRILKGGIALLP